MAPYNITSETVEWTWKIRDAEVSRKIDGRTDVVASILWSLEGEFFGPNDRPGHSDQYMQQVSGTTILAPPSDDNFSDISTVKKSVLRRWLLGTLTDFEQNEIKQKVLKKLDKTCNSDTYWLG
jgi:hypothetical protein